MLATNFIVHVVCLGLGVGFAFWMLELQSTIDILRSSWKETRVVDWLPSRLKRLAKAANVEFESALKMKEGSPKKLRTDRVLCWFLQGSVIKVMLSPRGVEVWGRKALTQEVEEIFQQDLGVSVFINQMEL